MKRLEERDTAAASSTSGTSRLSTLTGAIVRANSQLTAFQSSDLVQRCKTAGLAQELRQVSTCWRPVLLQHVLHLVQSRSVKLFTLATSVVGTGVTIHTQSCMLDFLDI